MEFTLTPFRENNTIERVEGHLEVQSGKIRCLYRVIADMSRIVWPPPQEMFEREFELWFHTCFEFFLGPESGADYLEFNLSPSGNWNSFSFTDLHKDMIETPALTLGSMTAHTDARQGEAWAVMNFDKSGIKGPVRIGVSAVIEETGGVLHHFALARPEGMDFHSRDIRLIQCEL